MISFALILMTLPSRVAAVRARHGESVDRTGRPSRTGAWKLRNTFASRRPLLDLQQRRQPVRSGRQTQEYLGGALTLWRR